VLVVATSDAEQLTAAARRMSVGSSLEQIDGCDEWTAPSLRVDSAHPTVLAGVDGEAMQLDAPLVIRVVPGALRVIVPAGTPGPPAPTTKLISVQALASLAEIAGGVAAGPYGEDE
jgi:diacylglycerol kinase family enzyme